MKNRKGFTLIELLAVIVILAIILVIAVPKILDVINGARSSSRDSSIKILKDTIKTQITASNMTNSGLFEKDSEECYVFDFDEENTNYQNLDMDNKDQFAGSIKYCSNGFDDSDLGFNGVPMTKSIPINSTNILTTIGVGSVKWVVINEEDGYVNAGVWQSTPVYYYYKDKVVVTANKPVTISGKAAVWRNGNFDNGRMRIGFSSTTNNSTDDFVEYTELNQNFRNTNSTLSMSDCESNEQNFEVTIDTPGEYYIKWVYYMTTQAYSAYSQVYDIKITK